jgi:copper resistance protein B
MNLHNYPLSFAIRVISFAIFILPIPSRAAMEDDPLLGKFILDKLETTDADGDSPLNWELDAWLGKDLNKIWFKSEGERLDDETEQRNELLFSRAISTFWDLQIGLRQDRAESASRDFFSAGVQGLMPYQIDTEASVVFGQDNQIGLFGEFEYEFMLTQRWVLSPEIEFDFWRENDPALGIGSGLSRVELGLRLGYEFRREFAPYIGISWGKKYGGTGDFARQEGQDVESTVFLAGVRIWF